MDIFSSDSETLFKCPCCGQQTWKKSDILTDLTKEYYLSCVLSGVPYSHTYKLFHGAVEIKCQDMTDQDIAQFRDIRSKFNLAEKDVTLDTFLAVMFQLGRLIMIQAIVKHLETEDKKVEPRAIGLTLLKELVFDGKVTGDSLGGVVSKLQQPAILLGISVAMLDKVLIEHQRVSAQLSLIGFDLDFYTGITHIS